MKIRFLRLKRFNTALGKDTVMYGGNTSCVEVISDDELRVIIDAGTGIRKINSNFKDDRENIM